MGAGPLERGGVIVAGIGCRRAVTAEAVVELVRRAAGIAGVWPALMAVPWFRAEEAALLDAARTMRLDLRSVERGALQAAQPRCRTRSEAALRAHGIASIAEGCALAIACAAAILLLPRIDGDGVTCALAGGPP